MNGKEMKLLSDEDVSFVQHPAPSLETLADFFFLVAGPWVLVKELNLSYLPEEEDIVFHVSFCVGT